MSDDSEATIEVVCPEECGYIATVPFEEWSKATYSMDAHGDVTMKSVPKALIEHVIRVHSDRLYGADDCVFCGNPGAHSCPGDKP